MDGLVSDLGVKIFDAFLAQSACGRRKYASTGLRPAVTMGRAARPMRNTISGVTPGEINCQPAFNADRGASDDLRSALKAGWQLISPGVTPLMVFRMGRACLLYTSDAADE